MPSKKKKYNARFPSGRIKKIMQTDEEVGKVAQAVPVIISRTLELFVNSLLTKAMEITSARNAKTLTPSHMKQCILSESRFDFLKDLVKSLPESMGNEADEGPTPPGTFSVQSSNLSLATETRRHSDCSNRIAIIQSPDTQQSRPSSFGNGINPNFYTENVEASASFRTPGEPKMYSRSSPVKAQRASRAYNDNDSSDEDTEDDLNDPPVLVPTSTYVQIPTSVEVDEDYDT